jgi:amidase
MSTHCYQSATALAKLIREGKATSTEIVKEHFARIHQHNPSLNAVVILLEEEALKTAAACDQEAKEGNFRGPLHGVPMTVKEQFWVKDTKSTLNFKGFKDWIAPQDAIVVERLRKAGAVILGKTNVSKNLLDYQISGDIYPEGKNPYNTEYSPGGSSGGSAAAVASGMVPIELGGDFGGSIRVPSNFCGLYGLKPTENTIPGHGHVPRNKGSKSFVFHMAVSGPIARVPEDLELVWNIIKGPSKGNRMVPKIDWNNPEGKKITDYKMAWVDGWPGFDTSRQTQEVIQKFIGLLMERGGSVAHAAPEADLHERSLDIHKQLTFQLTFIEVPWFIKPFLFMELKRKFLKGIKDVKWKFKDSLLDYSALMGKRAQVTREWEEFFERYDLLVSPMGFGPAFKRCKTGEPILYDGNEIVYINYVWPYVACFNASGHPAINIPLGIGNDGLPVGVQVTGAYWSEPDLLHFAKLVSEFTPGFIRPEGYGG